MKIAMIGHKRIPSREGGVEIQPSVFARTTATPILRETVRSILNGVEWSKKVIA